MKSTNSELPFVSVILPTYNHAEYIGKAIASVLNQTHKNLELIIIDNYSEDDTKKIVDSYKDNRIIYMKFRNNGIIAASRNHGIKQSRGEYIAFLDSDDVWHKQKLETQLPHFEISEIIGVASNATWNSETPYYRKNNYARSKHGYVDYKYKDILNQNTIITSSLIVRKETLNQSGLFDESKNYSCIEDWELWLRVARHGSFRVLEGELLTYLISLKRGYQYSVILKNSIDMIEKQVELGYAAHDDIIGVKVNIFFSIARNLLEYDQPQSRKYYIKAIKVTHHISKKIKGCVGLLLSFTPLSLMKIILLILYKADRLLHKPRDWLWHVKNLYGLIK